jgi:hypothetical protein
MLLEQSLIMEGSCDFRIFCENEKKYLLKCFRKNGRKFLNICENAFFHSFLEGPFHVHLVSVRNPRDYLKKELETWKLWKEEGIPCLSLKEYSKDKIIWQYEEGAVSIKRLVESKKSIDEFNNFLDLYQRIRGVAKIKQNPNYLHSDPHLSNFLFLANNQIIPIDSGCILKKNMSLEELDLHLLKRTIYALAGVISSEEDKKEYLQMFGQRLTNEEKDFLLNYNYAYSTLAKKYLTFREEIIHKLKGREKRNIFEEHNQFIEFKEKHFLDCLSS